MSNPRRENEATLIDYVLGQLEPAGQAEVRSRIESDAEFRRLHEDIRRTFSALDLAGEVEPPPGLAEKTLARVRSARQTRALIAREELTRPAVGPAFTFRELATAAAAVFILGIILLPSLQGARDKANRVVCMSQVGRIGAALTSYANTSGNNGYLPVADSLGDRWLPEPGSATASNSSALFRLINGGYEYTQSPTLFQCPAQGRESFQVTASMTDFPASRYIGYSYQHSVGSGGIRNTAPDLVAVADRMAILADRSPLFDEGGKVTAEQAQAKNSDNHGGSGQSVLYLDAHVEWADNSNVGVNEDNIYLVRGVHEYTGTETPADPTDSFLLPNLGPNNGAE